MSGVHVEKADRSVRELIDQIARSEIKLPELQRGFVWTPSQVAKLVDSLYRGYPLGGLLFWEADLPPETRDLAVAEPARVPLRPPLFLLDGQQRLTSLHRVITDHPDAQIVFHAESQRFQNQSASTAVDPRWIKVAEVVDEKASLLTLTRRLQDAGCPLADTEIFARLERLRRLRDRDMHLEILKGFPYEEVAEIFVRVNSAGRRLGTLDLAMATLSASWPGVLGKLEAEAAHWAGRGWPDLDVGFLSRAFAAVVLGSGLSRWSHGQLARATEDELERGWATVRRGLARLVPLLQANLGLARSEPLPTVTALIPLVVLLGERPDEPLDRPSSDAIVYWLLVATIRARYSSSTDTTLSKDIRAARRPDPVRALFDGLDLHHGRPRVTPEALLGRTKDSPFWFLSLLVAQAAGARDWWFGTQLLPGQPGQQALEAHHIHPRASLGDRWAKTDVNDLANLAHISGRANRRIGAQPPRDYFPTLEPAELAAQYVPTDEALLTSDGFGDFLAQRRRLLAAAMTDLLDRFRPAWLDRLPPTDEPPAGPSVSLVLYASAWEPGTLVFTAGDGATVWQGTAGMAELEAAVATAARTGFDGDVEIAGDSVPVQVVDEAVEVGVGPFRLTGTPAEWQAVFDRERADARPLLAAPVLGPAAWTGERVRFPVSTTV
jgi:hypothetical protein